MSESINSLPEVRKPNLAQEMKSIRKQKLQREVLADPSKAGELVKTQATGTYNTNGELVQAVSMDLGQA